MATTINLYSISDDPRKISKTLGTPLNGGTPIQLYLRDDSTDILTPEISFPYSALYATANYANIPAWNRYYFISGMRVTPAGRLFLQLKVDVLMTYATSILTAPVNVVRSESAGVNYIHDPELPINPDMCDYTSAFLAAPFRPITAPTTQRSVCVGVFNSRS